MRVACARRCWHRGWRRVSPYIVHAIERFATGIRTRNVEAFDAGLSLLKERIREWPTSDSNDYIDLYRYACWLREREFPEATWGKFDGRLHSMHDQAE